MKLWLLQPINGEDEVGAWKPWYDKAFGFVVRACSEEDARNIADDNAGAENGWNNKRHPWLDANQSICTELTTEGDVGVIMRDLRTA